MVKYIIFDIGEVLVNINFKRFVNEVTRTFQISKFRLYFYYKKETFHQLMSGEQTVEDVHQIMCREFKQNISLAEFKKVWVTMLDGPKTEVIQLVKNLRSKYQLVLLSNIEACHYEFLLETMEFCEYFDPHFVSYKMKVAKPDPLIYQKVLTQLQARPEECFFVDDRRENVKASQKLGIQSHRFKNITQLLAFFQLHNII